MKAFRFIHAADLHLDSPFVGMAELPLGIRESLRQSTFKAMANLVELAIQQSVDFVLISGDVYDLADRSLRAQIRFQKALQRLSAAGIASYIVHGNHDPEDGRAARLNWPTLAYFFSAREVESLPVKLEGKGTVAQIYGISYATAAVTENLAKRITEKYQQNIGSHSDLFRIGLLHTNVEGNQAHANYAPCSIQDLLGSGMDYWALGHVHTRQVLNTEPAIVYPGNLQGRSIRETEAKGCYIVDVSEFGEAKLTFHALDAIRWQQRSISIQGIHTEQELKERFELELEKAREDAAGRASIIRITLTDRGPIHVTLQKKSVLDELITELREDEVRRLENLGSLNVGLIELDGIVETADPLTGNYVWIESVQVHSGLEVDKNLLLDQESFLGDLLRLSESILTDEALLAAFCAETLDPLFTQSKAAKYLSGVGREEHKAWVKAAQELAIDFLAADARWDE
ncbi:DNA repair exonuclease [Paenibacillus psychroresistens]|uniref:DNA repair exonuclease n=1 Tax=Paenibacillus psychroresistens TaxID=1778678 RepID=A0A6B8RNI6_9BACL|nr:DNA repair exonuclease [Paenibacillus psychroresistens]QGQ97407.1 DNA repair exonuclease [Paenibacillus psychroresistens]